MMKEILICSIPMKDKIEKAVYKSEDPSLPASAKAFYYPVNSFLSETLSPGDCVDAVLIEKQGPFSNCEKNAELFQKELNTVCKATGADMSCKMIFTDFSQKKSVHEILMKKIID